MRYKIFTVLFICILSVVTNVDLGNQISGMYVVVVSSGKHTQAVRIVKK